MKSKAILADAQVHLALTKNILIQLALLFPGILKLPPH